MLEDLEDPSSRELMKYLVSCALPTGDDVTVTVQGTTYTFPGQLGLAPEWGLQVRTCDVSCQQWVSAVPGRPRRLPGRREISLRGDSHSLVGLPRPP